MKRVSLKISIFALALAFVASVSAFFSINFKPAGAATFTSRTTDIFNTSGDALILVDKQDNEYFSMFSIAGDASVSFKRNMAYHWFCQKTVDALDSVQNTVEEGLFNLDIGFKNTNFTKFVVTFESQSYTKTKDAKSTNYVMFFPYDAHGVQALITDNAEATKEDLVDSTIMSINHISIRFTQRAEDGVYKVSVGSTDDLSIKGEFKNVGGNYVKPVTADTSKSVTPLIFSAEFGEEIEGTARADMVLYNLNGQSFEVKGPTENGGTYSGGTITDDTPPVLCLTKEISYLDIGGTINFSYECIDVVRTSTTKKVYYYVLEYEDYIKNVNYNDKNLYTERGDDTVIESDIDKYLPSEAESANLGPKFYADMAIKVYVNMNDSGSTGNDCDVFLDWYLDDSRALKIKGEKFIAVGEDKQGAGYSYVNMDGQENGAQWRGVLAEYQSKIDELTKDLSAGSQSYLYLPSAEKLFADNANAYTDMKYSVYYYHSSQTSNTNLTSNNLSINVTTQGSYTFTIYATDAAGNSMYYIDGVNDDGTPNYVKFDTSKIWTLFDDEDLHDKLPWFTFYVGYTGADFEETPGKQSTAYVGTKYSSASFSINGVANSYEVSYSLYVFDRAAYYKDNNVMLTYSDFIEKMDELFENPATRVYFKNIPEVTETDANYEEFKDYEWSSSSTSFVPQDANTFYYIRAELTDKKYNTTPTTSSLAVVSSITSKTLKGESDWLKNNVASVVLLSVAGVSLIAIILLIVIKPKNKGDIDEQFEKDKAKAKSKRK